MSAIFLFVVILFELAVNGLRPSYAASNADGGNDAKVTRAKLATSALLAGSTKVSQILLKMAVSGVNDLNISKIRGDLELAGTSTLGLSKNQVIIAGRESGIKITSYKPLILQSKSGRWDSSNSGGFLTLYDSLLTYLKLQKTVAISIRALLPEANASDEKLTSASQSDLKIAKVLAALLATAATTQASDEVLTALAIVQAADNAKPLADFITGNAKLMIHCDSHKVLVGIDSTSDSKGFAFNKMQKSDGKPRFLIKETRGKDGDLEDEDLVPTEHASDPVPDLGPEKNARVYTLSRIGNDGSIEDEDVFQHAYRKSVPDLVGLATTQANKAREKSESGS